MDICTAQISGNLVRDPESKGQVTRIRVASKTREKDRDSGQWQDKSNFIDCTIFGAQGENAARFLTQGSRVFIAGRLDYSEWTDAEGKKRSAHRILVNDIVFPPKGDSARKPAQDELPF